MMPPPPPSKEPRRKTAAGLSYLAIEPASSGSSSSNNNPAAIILIHGWACQALDYVPLLRYFAAAAAADEHHHHQDDGDNDDGQEPPYQILALDLPGHGASPATLADPDISAFAQKILNFIDALQLKHVVLAGHSMGGRLVLEAYRLTHLPSQTAPSSSPSSSSSSSSFRDVHSKPSALIRGLVFIDCSSYRFRPGRFYFDAPNENNDNDNDNDNGKPAAPPPPTPDQTAATATIVQAFETTFSPTKTPPAFRATALEHVRTRDHAYIMRLRRSQIRYDLETEQEVLRSVGRDDAAAVGFLSFQSTEADARNVRTSLREGMVTRFMRHVVEMVPRARLVVVEEAGHFPHVDEWEFVGGELKAFADARLGKEGLGGGGGFTRSA